MRGLLRVFVFAVAAAGVALAASVTPGVGSVRAAARAQSCPVAVRYAAPTEAHDAAGGWVYPDSPALTRYAMVLAAKAAAVTPKALIPVLVPRVGFRIPAPVPPSPVQAQAGAAACGYSGRVQAVVLSAPLESSDDVAAWEVDTAGPKLRAATAIGVGAAFDRFGDFHVVVVRGSVDDSDGTDPYAAYTESKPAHPEVHSSGFLVIMETRRWTSKARRVCGLVLLPHIRVTVYRGARAIESRTTNAHGQAVLLVPPGKYGFSISGRVDGAKLAPGIERGYPVLAGTVMPLPMTIGGYGC
jgi:hypothetical protein